MRGVTVGVVGTVVAGLYLGLVSCDDLKGVWDDGVDKARTIEVPQAETAPTPPGKGALVARVIDGDTVELRNGSDVRVVGIDTPERGQCGYEAATDNMRALVEGERVRLVQPNGQDTDRYGRLIRVIKINGRDGGLAQIRGGYAIARYDSTDGYPRHPKQDRYHAATDAAKTKRAQVQATCEENR